MTGIKDICILYVFFVTNQITFWNPGKYDIQVLMETYEHKMDVKWRYLFKQTLESKKI